MQYALDKLSIITVLPGIRNDDLTRTLHYLEVSDVEKDYSILKIFPILESSIGNIIYLCRGKRHLKYRGLQGLFRNRNSVST